MHVSIPYDWQLMSRFLHPDDWDVQIGIRNLEPDTYWKLFEWARPAGYQFAEAYRNASTADYAELDAMYAAHVKTNPLDSVKKLTSPVMEVLPTRV